MEKRIDGLHHVTAIAGDPQKNINFYAGLLGLRLVKQTVNYDDPGSYHLYYGNESGEPGTVLTFFPWPGAPRGRRGSGQTTALSLSLPRDSISYWMQRLMDGGVPVTGMVERLGGQVISFEDPDGLALEIVETPDDARAPWIGGGIPVEHAIRGVHGVTLTETDPAETVELLTMLGYKYVADEGPRTRYALARATTGEALSGPGTFVDIVSDSSMPPGTIVAGTVHHIAFHAPDDAAQESWREFLLRSRIAVSPVHDRQYFQSIYFREPGGVLFEIATDGPGFLTDETPETLGTTLRLPSWLEQHRLRIETMLPRIERYGAKTAVAP